MSQLDTTNDEYLHVTVEVDSELAATATTIPSTTIATQPTMNTRTSTTSMTSPVVVTTAVVETDAVDLPEPISVSPVQTALDAEEGSRYATQSIPADFHVDFNNNNMETESNNNITTTSAINIISSNIVSNNITGNNTHNIYNNATNIANSRTNSFDEFNSFSASEVLSMQPSHGDLVVCNQALSNLCVYHFVPVDELEQSSNPNGNNNGNSNNINHNIGPNTIPLNYFNGNHSNYNNDNAIPQHLHHPEHLRRSTRRRERSRGRRSSRREKQSVRHSLKSMNNFLRKTVNTLKRIKLLILQQVQIARARHLASQLTL